MTSFRKIYCFFLILCIALLVVAIYVQSTYRIAPCPLCMLQRLIYVSILIVSILAIIHNPNNRLAKNSYCAMTLLFATAGIFLAARQSWLQHMPADKNATCLPGLKFLFQSMPFGQALKAILHGSQECSTIRWDFLKLSMAEWSLIFFGLVAVIMIIMLFINKNSHNKPS